MFKRKKMILSSIALLISFLIMGFGVYAASNPQIAITGQVTYTARDVKVTVQGKINGAKNVGTNEYPTSASSVSTNSSGQVTSYKYYSATNGTGFSDNNDNLAGWNFGGLEFAESASGVADIVVSFKLTNNSNYPVKASIEFDKTATELANQNVTRTSTKTESTLNKNASDEIIVTFEIINDATSITLANIGMNITFRSALETQKVVTYDANGLYFTNPDDISDTSATTYQQTGTTFDSPTNLFNRKPDTPTSFRSVIGWYTNKQCTGAPVEFPFTPSTKNTVLYAKWETDMIIYDIPLNSVDVHIYIGDYKAISFDVFRTETLKSFAGLFASEKQGSVLSFPSDTKIDDLITLYNNLQCLVYDGKNGMVQFFVCAVNGKDNEYNIKDMTWEEIQKMVSEYNNTAMIMSLNFTDSKFAQISFVQSLYNAYHEKSAVPDISITVEGEKLEGREDFAYWD